MGTVYLIGLGPGDPGLITLKGADILRRADVVLSELPISPRIRVLLRPGVRLYAPDDAGASGGRPTPFAAAAVELARENDVVARLLPGDPFLSGDAVAEARRLRIAGIDYEVVPGLPACVAAPVYAGIALGGDHHAGSGLAGAFGGRSGDAAAMDRLAPAWAGMVRDGGTVVIEISDVVPLEALAARLVQEGLAPDVPAAVIARGTEVEQRVAEGPLIDIGSIVERSGMIEPSVLVLGSAVHGRRQLDWFERRPLFGMRIVITRAEQQVGDLPALLSDLGAVPLEFPAIRIAPPEDPSALRLAAHQLSTYDWVVFTSVNGVARFWAELEEAGGDARAFGGARVACIGPATAAALELHGIRADLVPERFIAEAVLDALAAADDLDGKRILLPRAAGARSVLPDGLLALGARVNEVEAYRSVPDGRGAAELRLLLDRGEVDVLTFTASSTVDNFVEAVGADAGGAAVAAIGPITAATARDHGLSVDLVAEDHTIPGLVRALEEWARREMMVTRRDHRGPGA